MIRILITLMPLFLRHAAGEISAEDCGVTKVCHWNTPNCSLTDPTCLFFSYVWDASASNFFMEMSGGTGNGVGYHGVAFSPTGTMVESDLYMCTGNAFQSGVIIDQNDPDIGQTLLPGVVDSTQETVDGVAKCTFRRLPNVTKTILDQPKTFDLLNGNFYLLQAFGSIFGDYNEYHATDRWHTNRPLNFTLITTKLQSETTSTPSSPPQTNFNPHTTSMLPSNFSTSLPVSSTRTESSSMASPTAGCDTEAKTCFHNPPGCNPTSDNPCMFASWAYVQETKSFKFEIIGGFPGGVSNQYVSIAFGKVMAMQDADLYYCTEDQFTSGAIQQFHRPPMVLPDTNGISNIATSSVNGVIRCSFTRDGSITKPISNQQREDFDLVKKSYYFLMAIGETSDEGTVKRHGVRSTDSRIVTDTKIDFSNAGNTLSFNVKLFFVYALLSLIGISLAK